MPGDAPYASAQALQLREVALNGGAIAATGDAGVHLVAYFGDANGNEAYSATDASRILRLAVGLDGGLAAYTLVDPVILADINGNGSISATDATRILQHAVGLTRPEIPPLPGDGLAQAVAVTFAAMVPDSGEVPASSNRVEAAAEPGPARTDAQSDALTETAVVVIATGSGASAAEAEPTPVLVAPGLGSDSPASPPVVAELGREAPGRLLEDDGAASHALRLSADAADRPAGDGGARLTRPQLAPLVDEAIRRWREAGLTRRSIADLHRVDVRIGDLSGDLLARTSSGVVWIDPDAAGQGWYIDARPSDDLEFRPGSGRPTPRGVDLLTAVAHELGHVLGWDDQDDQEQGADLMANRLPTKTRRLPTARHTSGAEALGLGAQAVPGREDGVRTVHGPARAVKMPFRPSRLRPATRPFGPVGRPRPAASRPDGPPSLS